MHVLIIDDHDLMRDGLRLLASRLADEVTVDEARDMEAARQCAAETIPELVILDYFLPDVGGMQALREMRALVPEARIVVFTSEESPTLAREVLREGARGYIPKSYEREVIIRALQLVLAGGVFAPGEMLTASEPAVSEGSAALTERQVQILRMLAAGSRNREIASELGVSQSTVRAHITAIYKILDVDNRSQATREAVRLGLAID